MAPAANRVIAPVLMWAFARVFVPELDYRAGLNLLGVAPCTVMVAMISSSSQFEVAIGTAMVLVGIGSRAALAAVTGPLLEIPLMVTAAKLLRRSARHFVAGRGWQPEA